MHSRSALAGDNQRSHVLTRVILQCLPLMLGPDFITDEIVVETSDHARLKILYAVNNHFEVNRSDDFRRSPTYGTSQVEEAKKTDVYRLFAVADFIGFVSRSLASRIRGMVAQVGEFIFFADQSNDARLTGSRRIR